MDKQLKLVLGLVLSMPLVAQMPILPGVLGPPLAASGTSITANFGGTGQAGSATGNALYMVGSLFTTGNWTSTVNNLGVWWGAPASAEWGLALYSDLTGTGTVNTQNAASGSCTADCVTWVSGTTFNTQWEGDQIVINGVTHIVMTVFSSTLMQLTSTVAVGNQSGVAFSAHAPGNLICSAASAGTPPSGWTTLTPSGCGTLAANTSYWATQITASNTQEQGNSAIGPGPGCSTGGYAVFSNTPLSSFTGNSSWPSNWSSYGSSDNGNCFTTYASLTYTSTQPYNIITVAAGAPSATPYCSASLGPTCTLTFPPFQAGHSLIGAIQNVASGGFLTISSATDSASDTVTVNTQCNGSGNYANCFISVPLATTGVNSLTITFSGGGHYVFVVMEVAGTLSSGSYDKSATDTALLGTPFTSANATGTLSQAQEFAIGQAWNDQLGASADGNGTFSAGGNWNVLYQGQNSESAGNLSNTAVFYQITSATTSLHMQGSFAVSGTSNLPALATYR
jgi:hypothetical protein